MSAKARLRSAIRAIDDAKTALRRARDNADPDSEHYIRRAISELEEAESLIKRASREITED